MTDYKVDYKDKIRHWLWPSVTILATIAMLAILMAQWAAAIVAILGMVWSIALMRQFKANSEENTVGWQTFQRINGYLAIPHELLHVLGYRLVGKRCVYRWGDNHVRPINPLTQREELVGLLFPFLACGLMFIFFIGLSILAAVLVALWNASPFWIVFWGILAIVSGIYSSTSLLDLRRAYLLIFNKSPHSWTPFDLFLWPVIEDIIASKPRQQ